MPRFLKTIGSVTCFPGQCCLEKMVVSKKKVYNLFFEITLLIFCPFEVTILYIQCFSAWGEDSVADPDWIRVQ
jgi:hypothetical protein